MRRFYRRAARGDREDVREPSMTEDITIQKLLDVEPLEMNLFRGQHEGGPTNTRAFGGLGNCALFNRG